MSDALFHVEPIERPQPAEGLSADARRTLRQLAALRAGTHPLGMYPRILPGHLPLHPDAPAADDRDATGPRCGNCRWRRNLTHHDSTHPKCTHPGTRGADEYEQHGGPRMTHGAASDVRAWWPGCRDWEPGDPALPDAMRWVPDVRGIR